MMRRLDISKCFTIKTAKPGPFEPRHGFLKKIHGPSHVGVSLLHACTFRAGARHAPGDSGEGRPQTARPSSPGPKHHSPLPQA
jgi:hypothetical protein